MKYFFTLLLALSFACAYSQNGYPVKNIPDSLLENADAVIRLDDMQINIASEKKMVTKYHLAITILNERAKEEASFSRVYDKLSSISNFKGCIYNPSGERVKKIKESDLGDISVNSQSTLFEDTRRKYYDLEYPSYPYTVEYEWTETENSIFIMPVWVALNDYERAVQNTSIQITYPSELNLRTKTSNLIGSIQQKEADGKKNLSYSISNLKAIKEEPLSHPLLFKVPAINIGIDIINYDGFQGKQSNWNEFGASMHTLWSNRDDISPALNAKFGALKGKTMQEIADAVRLYLKENTRYVNINLGVGGFQPFKASMVEKTGYGDCKALTNFAYTLFKAAGVTSYPALVSTSGNEYVDENFTKSRFNHVFLCIPNGKDSLWLECTNPTYSTGYLSSHDSNRKVLIFGPEGGKMAKTPKHPSSENLQVRNTMLTLTETGNITGSIKTVYKNEQAEIPLALSQINQEDQRKYILNSLPFSNPVLTNITLKNHNTPDQKMEESYDISATMFASQVGKRLFVPTIPLERQSLLTKLDKRKSEIVKRASYRDVDTITYKIPAGYKVEALPQSQKMDTDFGKYECSAKEVNGSVVITKIVELFEGTYPATKYNELYHFHKKMSSSDNSKFILVKETL
ncbi:DUF3857 domain-containing protein [Alistipes sp. ZOR0009]|uniref:DUF3857 domain-containing protein n=1 Tax=Alistipes sp. ZOR0009 TaxID=1339253 RepID=UPI000648E80F|nr:DUF3857 domain-containing protein [Alistipes sp. ZOR0009]